jgi:hypothetical protein
VRAMLGVVFFPSALVKIRLPRYRILGGDVARSDGLRREAKCVPRHETGRLSHDPAGFNAREKCTPSARLQGNPRDCIGQKLDGIARGIRSLKLPLRPKAQRLVLQSREWKHLPRIPVIIEARHMTAPHRGGNHQSLRVAQQAKDRLAWCVRLIRIVQGVEDAGKIARSPGRVAATRIVVVAKPCLPVDPVLPWPARTLF